MTPRDRLPPIEPIRHLAELDGYVGLWVAVKDGIVAVGAATSTEVAEMLHAKGVPDAVIQYVPEPSEVEKVGLG